ncbi:MAG: IgGFc-binding protein, partial [Minicystis sp.]
SGTGPSLSYAPFDPAAGLAPGEVVILFLGGAPGSNVPCPAGVTSAVPSGSAIVGTSGVGKSFHITSDVPVVAYQINPYGGGSAAVTGASLLLPTSVWDKNYVAVTVTPYDIYPPSMNIVAAEDNTKVTMLPITPVQGGGALASGPANTPYVFTLNKGEQAQFTQHADLTGSVIESDKPVGFMAGQPCMRAPQGVAYCDHGEQMVPPVKALGHEYVGVMYRPRIPGDQAIWHIVGAVDGTQLTWSSNVGGPSTINAGQAVDFITEQPFTVQSQDGDHPFMLFTYMSGSTWKPGMDGYGDADFVISVPPAQYMSEYVFFTDPTYPETNLVIVRAKGNNGFEDVELDCAGVLGNWQPVGEYEWTRVDLISHNFQNQGNCSTGRHQIKSKGRFGLWVWGWGTPETGGIFTENVSYGYPGGMNVQSINEVVILPTPK